MGDIDKIFNDEAFDGIEENRKAALKELYIKLKGKSVEEALPIIMAFKMPKGRNITNVERNAMFKAVMEDMNEKDKTVMEKILKIIGM